MLIFWLMWFVRHVPHETLPHPSPSVHRLDQNLQARLGARPPATIPLQAPGGYVRGGQGQPDLPEPRPRAPGVHQQLFSEFYLNFTSKPPKLERKVGRWETQNDWPRQSDHEERAQKSGRLFEQIQKEVKKSEWGERGDWGGGPSKIVPVGCVESAWIWFCVVYIHFGWVAFDELFCSKKLFLKVFCSFWAFRSIGFS